MNHFVVNVIEHCKKLVSVDLLYLEIIISIQPQQLHSHCKILNCIFFKNVKACS